MVLIIAEGWGEVETKTGTPINGVPV